MRQVGDLWVWADPDTHRLMLGNRAAALQQDTSLGDTVTGALPSVEKPVGGFRRVGVFAVTQGPAVDLRVALDPELSGDPAMLEVLLAPLAVDRPANSVLDYSADPRGRHLWRDGVLVASGPRTDGGAGQAVNLHLELLRALLEPWPVMTILHGSAVRWQGRNLVFMGVSGSGKSTLAALLAAHGGRYLGDDLVALLSPDHAVFPLPFAPSLKEGSWPVVMPHFPALAQAPVFRKGTLPLRFLPDAPTVPGTDAGPADLLVFPRFSATEAPKAVHLTPVETLLELSRSGLWLAPGAGDALIDWACNCPAIVLRHTPDFAATRGLLAEALAA
jgi:hypothetical protein